MKTAKQISFMIFTTVFLILIIAFCISGTVISQNKHGSRAEARYFNAIEQEYTKAVRKLLAEKGCENSGITMTRVTDTDGSREYTVTIHHRRLSRLSEEEKQELLSECKDLEFPDKESRLFHKFLEEDL